jgi:hypothetical protein
MKILQGTLLLLFFSVFISSVLQAQSAPEKKELLLRTEELKASRVFRISQQLSAIEGVHFWGYISKTQTLMITYDEERITDWSIILTTIEHFNKGICMEILENETIFASIDKSENEADQESQ